MLVTDDIGKLFGAMRTAYGNQWKHGSDAIGIWRNALNRFDPSDLEVALVRCMDRFVDYPPTLPQFIKLLEPQKERPNTYLPAPQMKDGEAMANRLMLLILRNHLGVDIVTLRKMARVKIDMVNNLKREPDEQFLIDLESSLNELAENQDFDAKREELLDAHRVYCIRNNIPQTPYRKVR
jgi:hypothetical protein